VAIIHGGSAVVQGVTWKRVSYPANYTATAPSQVAVTPVGVAAVPELGAWQKLQFDGVPVLTGRVVGESLLLQLNAYGRVPLPSGQPNGPYPGGCCADTLRAFARADGAILDFALDAAVAAIFKGVALDDPLVPGTTYACAPSHPTHCARAFPAPVALNPKRERAPAPTAPPPPSCVPGT
jgi:hypothetical protein